jgi:hypothetical protein
VLTLGDRPAPRGVLPALLGVRVAQVPGLEIATAENAPMIPPAPELVAALAADRQGGELVADHRSNPR